LTSLICAGFDTLPIANGFDEHGKHILLFNAEHKLDLVIGYLHKVISPVGSDVTSRDILHTCITYQMPTLLVCPEEHHEAARKLIGDTGDIISLVDPGKLKETALKILCD
jgi:hypothetical protein